MKIEDLKLYIVRNAEGKFFRAKGIAGTGASWVDDPNKARLYTKLGPARSTVTYFVTRWTQLPFPEIIQIGVCNVTVLDETKRIHKLIQKNEFDKKRWADLNAQFKNT